MIPLLTDWLDVVETPSHRQDWLAEAALLAPHDAEARERHIWRTSCVHESSWESLQPDEQVWSPALQLADELVACNADIQARRAALASLGGSDSNALAREIDRLEKRAAALIRARADAKLGPLSAAIDRAGAEARKLLGK